jgi:hypothetical protein
MSASVVGERQASVEYERREATVRRDEDVIEVVAATVVIRTARRASSITLAGSSPSTRVGTARSAPASLRADAHRS